MKNVDVVQYQNANQSFDSIVENFIVRKSEFERVMDDIRSTDPSSSFQHYVFVGRRGSGKSTLLRRIQAEINIDDTLHVQYEVVNLGEEQSFIYRLYDLWDYVKRELSTFGYQFEELDFRTYKDEMTSYTKDLHAQIVTALRSKNKRLILLLDNIDRILDSRSGNLDAALFRELLINYHDIRIIGGSTFMSEHFWKYDKPFYQFFTIKKLEALSLKEVEELLIHWSEVKQIPAIKDIIKNHPGKIQSIRMLTDGMPRTMLLFVDMMINRPEQNGYQYLQQIVDKATPIYQERLGLLSDAQKKVLSELAFIWDAANVEELVPKCNMEGKVISALLNQLTDIRYVEKIKTKNKNNLYRLEERFFNLWFNMTQGGLNNRAKAKALTDFLEKWYEKTALNDLCLELTSLVVRGEANKDYIESMSQALLGSEYIDSKYKQALKSQLSSKGFVKELRIEASYDAGQKNISEAIANKEYQKVITLLENAKIEEGLKYLGLGLAYQILNDLINAEKYYLLAIEKGVIKALNNLANLYDDQGKAEQAEKYYLLAIEKGVIVALNNLANLYKNQGMQEQAEKYYLLAIEKGVLDALSNLANLYKNQGNVEQAEKYYLLAIEKGVIKALNNLANLYDDQGNAEQAEKYYLLAIEKGVKEALNNLANLYKNQGNVEQAEKYYLLAIEKGVIKALNNLANLYDDQGNAEQAEKYYLLAIEKGVKEALNNLANFYDDQGKAELAEKYYLLAIEKGVIDALNNLAILYQNQGKAEEAEKYYLLAIEKGVMDALNNLANLYDDRGNVEQAEKYYLLAIEKGDFIALNNLALLYKNQGNAEQAEKYYLLAIEKGVIDALNNLAILYQNQGKAEEAEKYYLLAIEKGVIDALNNLANLYQNQGKVEEAAEYYLLAIEKGDLTALYNLANLYYVQGNVEQAEKYYLLAIEKGDIKALYNLALLYQNQGKAEEAGKYYLLAIEKGVISSLNNLANLYYDQGKAKQAEKYYLLAIEKGDLTALNNLANLYYNQGNAEQAEKYYLLAIEKGVKEALNNLANLYYDQGNAEQAEKYYLLAIEKGVIDALNKLANLYYDQGNAEQAEKYYLLAIEKGDIDALYNLVVLLFKHYRKSELKLLINRQPKAIMDGFINENLEFAVLTFLYIDDFDSFKTLSDKLLSDKKALSSALLKELLIHRQYHWVYKYFTAHEEMIETYNPLYYATLHLMGDKDQEILKMPPEIKESVESILDSIKKGQEFYGM